MAEQVTNDVVKEAQSVGRPAPIDDTASTTNLSATNGTLPPGPATTLTKSSDSSSNATHPIRADTALLNGDSADHSAAESQAVADGSGGSDTDISRPGSVDQSKREAGHVRTGSNAVKKASTFKSVSVTKNFLAKSAVSTPVARPGDKATSVPPSNSTSALTAARPRLVAKLGTGNAPRTLTKVNGASSGPDASKVWNKNQPVPPPPPKQFTDEELKQQYGIHLATRLQADEAGKEAKWADIDDDEDDWAPDTVQWMDGTKSSGAVVETEPPATEEPKPVSKATSVAPSEMSVETHKAQAPMNSNVAKTSVTGGTKTILKPGVHGQPATGKTSLVLKGQPEKPTLVAKPSTSEKKSPWAPLPPVEKVPPVQINPPQQAPQQRFSQRDSYGYDPMPPLPAKEIAPDDFNRSWRDERGGRPELYNSQSGRYEPVNEMRRGSMRDSGFRQQPSVLQRPSQDGPAEPSAAFQTSRSGVDAPMWGRRRNSSNVSGSHGRRMSFDRRGTDMPSGPMGMERRESLSINGLESSDTGASRQASITIAASPNAAHAHPASPFGSVASSSAHDPPAPANALPAEDPVEVQKRLMADKIERARLKKQQEQEAEKKEEAERKERLAKRLAAMGLPAEKPKAKEQSPTRSVGRSPQKDRAVPATVQSPPKPPVPTSDGEVAQYGMMKVHQAQPVKRTSPVDSSLVAKGSVSTNPITGSSPVKAQTVNETRSPSLAQHPAQPFDAFRDNEKIRQPSDQSKGTTQQQSEGAMSSGPKPSTPQNNWQSAAPQPRPWTSQVWGPPQTRDRALGNGTFVSSYDRSQPRSVSQQQLSAQAQPGSTAPAPLGLTPQPANTLPASTLSANKSMAPAKQGPINPLADKGWGNYAAHIAQDDRNLVNKARQDLDRLGGETFRPEIRETYKDQRGQSQTTLHDKVANNIAIHQGNMKKDDVVKPVLDGTSPQQALGQVPALQQTAGPRASRFFPRSTDAANLTPTATSTKMDSPPPPPETESHPAFTGNTNHPLVRLPKPSPVVRLPPQASGGTVSTEGPVSMPTRSNHALGARPLAMSPEWQDRFNSLLGKPGASAAHAAVQAPATRTVTTVSPIAPSKPGSLPVAASSKVVLDVRSNTGSATVSLPNVPFKRVFADDQGSEAITRKGTESLFEDREFGSLPTVKMSQVAHLAANEAAVTPPMDDTILARFKKIENPFTTRRLEAFDFEKGVQRIEVVIRLNSTRESVTRTMPRRHRWTKANNQHTKPKRSNIPNGTPSNSGKDKSRNKISQQPHDGQTNSSTRPSSSSANTWNSNNRPSPAHSSTTWARLAAAHVH